MARKMTAEKFRELLLIEAARRIVVEFDEWGETLQVGPDDEAGTYGPSSAIENLRSALLLATGRAPAPRNLPDGTKGRLITFPDGGQVLTTSENSVDGLIVAMAHNGKL